MPPRLHFRPRRTLLFSFLGVGLFALVLLYFDMDATPSHADRRAATASFRGRVKLHGAPVSPEQWESPSDSDPGRDGFSMVNPDVFVFYYPWYGTPDVDGKWIHWNHEVLDPKVHKRFEPPDDIGSSFFPQAGLYSSKDDSVTRQHMRDIRQCGIGTIVLSWWGRESADSQGGTTDEVIGNLLDLAAQEGLKVALHLEPYKGRSAESVMEDAKYMNEKYFSHPAAYKSSQYGDRPIVFVYDSYLIPETQWRDALSAAGTKPGDGHYPLYIGLVVNLDDTGKLTRSLFDGWYTYFATDGFTYGSTQKHWKDLASRAQKSGHIFIPSVGPGYDDIKIRPWNGRNQRDRKNGLYYNDSWQRAIDAVESFEYPFVSITSWNEFHEGTQIEPCVPKAGFDDFLPENPEYYLTLTRTWVDKFSAGKNERQNATDRAGMQA